MLENFHLAVIAKKGSRSHLLRVPLEQDMQRELAENWDDQNNAYCNDITEVDFNAGYTPDGSERFSIVDYDLPDWLTDHNSTTIQYLDSLHNREELMASISGVVAMARDNQGRELMLFQNFTGQRVVRPGRFLLLEFDTYTGVQRPGLILDEKLCAVYLSTERKLLFHNFRTVNTFLPLTEYYMEASEQEIREILEHPLIIAEDPDFLATSTDQWFRKRFAMLRDSGILNQFSAIEIEARSTGHNVTIAVQNGRIVFPAEKALAKRLLQFLNEEIYKGPITDNLYETNSKKQST